MTRRSRRRFRVRVITWNVHIRNRVVWVLVALVYFTRRYGPDVIVLQEASKLYGRLGRLPYHVIQAAPDWQGRGIDEAANIAILVAKRHRVRKSYTMHMHEAWRGPVHGWPHPPRQFQGVVVEDKHGRRLVSVLGVHIGFGDAARVESLHRIGHWLDKGTGIAPRVAAGDYNAGLGTVRTALHRIARRIKVTGRGVDQAASTHARRPHTRRLGRHHSDHHAVLSDLEHGPRKGGRR